MTTRPRPAEPRRRAGALRRLVRAYAQIFRAIAGAFRTPRVQALLLVCLLLALAQAFVFSRIEGWRFLDAFYFAVISMATVGYGDLTPSTPLGKAFAVAFLLIGVGVFVLAVSSIAEAILRDLRLAERQATRRPPNDTAPETGRDTAPPPDGQSRKGG